MCTEEAPKHKQDKNENEDMEKSILRNKKHAFDLQTKVQSLGKERENGRESASM